MGMDHYTIVKELGGSTGTFLAVDRQNKSRRVVIKRLTDGTRGVQELNVSLRVRHPNIITFLESFVHEGTLYAVLAYAEGGDLEAHLERMAREKKPLNYTLLLRWFKQLIGALQCCHEQKILHRDVKPGNVFLNADGSELYLGDFGSAKSLLRSASLTKTFVGTPIWISPELLTGTPYSYPADVWSLGCVFYEMVALKRPFSPSNLASLVQQITSGDIAPLPTTVPKDIRKIVTSMLQVDPNKRCSLAEALAMTERAEKSREENGGVASPQPQPRGPVPPKAQKFQRLPTRHVPQEGENALKNGGQKAKQEGKQEGKKSEVADQRLGEWIRARNHDVSVIQNYLNKFRQSDGLVLTASASPSENVPRDREPRVTVAPAKRVLISPKKISPSRRVKPAAKSRVHFVCGKGTTRANGCDDGARANMNASPLAREPSALHGLNGDALQAEGKAFKRLSSAPRNNLPLQSPQQVEHERQLVREKRDQERTKMLEMIREQKAKAMKERKARGKSESRDAVAVEIVLPDNLRYIDGAAR